MLICAFTDGSSYTHFVGKKSMYKYKLAFLQECFKEFDVILEGFLTEEEWGIRKEIKNIELVYDNLYCRYYHHMSEEVSYLGLESGYLFCDKARGAFEVFAIDVTELVKAIKEYYKSTL